MIFFTWRADEKRMTRPHKVWFENVGQNVISNEKKKKLMFVFDISN